MNKKIRAIGAGVLVAVWLGLTAMGWFGPAKDVSAAERRPLKQMPEFTSDTVLSGKFMTDFDGYTLDQFPFRDRFRQLKSLFHYYAMGQMDNNKIYIADGHAAKMEYPLSVPSIKYALNRFNHVYETYLKDTGSHVVFAVAPDKGYYLAQQSGHLALDYEEMFRQLQAGMPWADYVDLTDTLSLEDYYFTDTHWRQERILPAAEKLCAALGVTAPDADEYTPKTLERPFYGVYYGQAALPMKPEPLSIMRTDILDQCRVYDHETGKYTEVYDMEKAAGKDMYEVFLSGTKALLTVENPNASTDRELIVFRDSFGSSMTPLLLKDYRSVTLVDLRYIGSDMLGEYLDFHGQDVLMLYSSLVLNSSTALK